MNKMSSPLKQFIRDKLQVIHGLFVDVEDFDEIELLTLRHLINVELNENSNPNEWTDEDGVRHKMEIGEKYLVYNKYSFAHDIKFCTGLTRYGPVMNYSKSFGGKVVDVDDILQKEIKSETWFKRLFK